MARVLVIDDDADIAGLVRLKLELDGHHVTVENDGAAGLARALAERPDVVVVDWTLPGLTGPEICDRLRRDEALSATRLIMLTARPMDDAERSATGADEVVSKPFSLRDLAARVNAAPAR